MRLASLMLAALAFAAAGLAPVLAQEKTIPPVTAPSPSARERAFLYEEVAGRPEGRRLDGSVTWQSKTITITEVSGAKERVIIGKSEIPERQMRMTLTLRRNSDQSLPVSHIIDFAFKLPSDFQPDDTFNVPAIWTTTESRLTGAPLAGLAVKVTTDFFLIGLSQAPGDQDRNVAMLKQRPWLVIPIVFANNQRAKLALEKGASGDKAFAQTFAEWEK